MATLIQDYRKKYAQEKQVVFMFVTKVKEKVYYVLRN